MENKVMCIDCKYFGYNNGKALNKANESVCLKRREKVNACQNCKNFEKCHKK